MASFVQTSALRTLFTRADLDRANLARCDLREANLSLCTLRYCDLSHAKLDRADCTHADLTGSLLHRMTELETKWFDATLADVARTDPKLAAGEDFAPPRA